MDLLASVVGHQKVFFREAAARTIWRGQQIRRDYRDRQEMFFGEAPWFDALMADRKELEDPNQPVSIGTLAS